MRYANEELRLEDKNNPTVLSYIINEILSDDLQFQHPVYKQLFNELVLIFQNGQAFDEHYFTRHENAEICRATVDLTTDNYEISTIWRKNEVLRATDDMKLHEIVPQLVMAFKNKKVIDMIRNTQEEIRNAQSNNDSENLTILQQKFIVLNELKKQFSKKLGDRIIY